MPYWYDHFDTCIFVLYLLQVRTFIRCNLNFVATQWHQVLLSMIWKRCAENFPSPFPSLFLVPGTLCSWVDPELTFLETDNHIPQAKEVLGWKRKAWCHETMKQGDRLVPWWIFSLRGQRAGVVWSLRSRLWGKKSQDLLGSPLPCLWLPNWSQRG